MAAVVVHRFSFYRMWHWLTCFATLPQLRIEKALVCVRFPWSLLPLSSLGGCLLHRVQHATSTDAQRGAKQHSSVRTQTRSCISITCRCSFHIFATHLLVCVVPPPLPLRHPHSDFPLFTGGLLPTGSSPTCECTASPLPRSASSERVGTSAASARMCRSRSSWASSTTQVHSRPCCS